MLFLHWTCLPHPCCPLVISPVVSGCASFRVGLGNYSTVLVAIGSIAGDTIRTRRTLNRRQAGIRTVEVKDGDLT